jgi:Zn-dependent protease with chaperone function
MGHYVLGHVRKGILFACAVLLFFLYLAYRVLHWTLARWGETWAIRGPDDLASLPVFVLLLAVFGFLFTPISNAYSRHLEHQADQYGLEVIHGLIPDAPVVAAHAFQILGEVDLEEPHPSTAVKFWFYTHPPLDERMRFAQTYDPWSQGRAPEFVTGAGSTSSPPK